MKIRVLSAVATAALAAACAAPKPKPSPAPAPARPSATAKSAAPAPAATAAPAVVVAPKGPRHKFWGDVTAVAADGSTVTVKSRSGKTKTFRLASAAKLTKGGDDVKTTAPALSGAHVRVTYAGDVAVAVHVLVPTGQ